MTNATTIEISEETRNKLVNLKYKFGCKGYDEVIDRLLAILTKFKLTEEFKEIGK